MRDGHVPPQQEMLPRRPPTCAGEIETQPLPIESATTTSNSSAPSRCQANTTDAADVLELAGSDCQHSSNETAILQQSALGCCIMGETPPYAESERAGGSQHGLTPTEHVKGALYVSAQLYMGTVMFAAPYVWTGMSRVVHALTVLYVALCMVTWSRAVLRIRTVRLNAWSAVMPMLAGVPAVLARVLVLPAVQDMLAVLTEVLRVLTRLSAEMGIRAASPGGASMRTVLSGLLSTTPSQRLVAIPCVLAALFSNMHVWTEMHAVLHMLPAAQYMLSALSAGKWMVTASFATLCMLTVPIAMIPMMTVLFTALCMRLVVLAMVSTLSEVFAALCSLAALSANQNIMIVISVVMCAPRRLTHPSTTATLGPTETSSKSPLMAARQVARREGDVTNKHGEREGEY